MKLGFETVRVENEKLLKLQDNLGLDQARIKAEDYKSKVFSSLFNFVLNPGKDDIEIVYEEKRYEAFWHLVGYANLEYKRKAEYQLNVDANVKSVEICQGKFDLEKVILKLPAIEICEDNLKEELFVDANFDQGGDFAKYLKYEVKAIESTEELLTENTLITSLNINSNNLVKQMLLKLVKPVEHLEMLKEEVVISELALYFHPLYTFEYVWSAKNKKAVISFDGVTGEIYTKANKIGETLKKNFNRDDLFEFGKEIAENVVPGGGIAVLLGKKMLEISKKK